MALALQRCRGNRARGASSAPRPSRTARHRRGHCGATRYGVVMNTEDNDAQDSLAPEGGMSRRRFVGSMIGGGIAAGATAAEPAAAAKAPAGRGVLRVNGASYELPADPRVTLLDFVRERLNLTGTKKG